MKTTFCLLLLLFVLLFVLVPDPCELSVQPDERGYTRASEALHDWLSEGHGWLSEPATLYLLQELGLDWKFSLRPRYNSWDDVCVYRSDNGQYFILVGARAGEWGQHGHAVYCLIDSSGKVYWQRPGHVDAPPRVSGRGTVALRFADGPPDDRRSWSTFRTDFIAVNGDSLGSIRWTDRVNRPIQRRFVEEMATFSPDGDVFITTMNLSEGLDEGCGSGINNTFLFAVRHDGSLAWRRYLDGFWPKSMEFLGEPESLRLDGEWRERIILNGSSDEGFIVFDLDGNLLDKVITRHIDFEYIPE